MHRAGMWRFLGCHRANRAALGGNAPEDDSSGALDNFQALDENLPRIRRFFPGGHNATCLSKAKRVNVATLCLSMHARRSEETFPVPAGVDASTSIAVSRVTPHPSTG
jgi:hypothetical protein